MFIGRVKEIQKLQQLRSETASAIAVLYGRRRVGKSALIREAFQKERVLNFEGLENKPPREQIRNFLFQLKQQREDLNFKNDINDWRDALAILVQAVGKQSHVVVLDEFQWMASYKDDLVTNLKMMWDQYFSKCKNITFVLCGSIASFMIEKVIRSKALYGRIQLEMSIEPFKLKDASLILKDFGQQELLEASMLLGGIPLYLNLLKDKPSLHLAIDELAFQKNGFFTKEYERIFLSHFGKRKAFVRLVEALGKHEHGLYRSEISSKTGIELSGHLTDDLNDLEAAGFIRSFVPFDKNSDSKIKKYVLTDPYLRFYLKFIEPALPKIQLNQKDIFLKLTQSPKFHSFLGYAFEQLCFQHLIEISNILGFSGVDFRAGRYFRKEISEQGIEIDLLFDRADRVLTLCEMKYQSQPVGLSIIPEVERKVALLSKMSRHTIQKVLIVKDEVTKDLLRKGYFYKIIKSSELI